MDLRIACVAFGFVSSSYSRLSEVFWNESGGLSYSLKRVGGGILIEAGMLNIISDSHIRPMRMPSPWLPRPSCHMPLRQALRGSRLSSAPISLALDFELESQLSGPRTAIWLSVVYTSSSYS